MSEEENNESGESVSDELETNSSESLEAGENDPKPSDPPSKSGSIMYGTRKLHPGAKPASAQSLNQLRGPYEDDDILEMDDLVVKSTAPAHLIEGDSKPGRRREKRRSDEREPENSEPPEASEEPIEETDAYPQDEPEEENRPERFAEVERAEQAQRRGVQEFRPSKDGKRSHPKKKKPSKSQSNSAPVEESKGVFGWLRSLFLPGDNQSADSGGSDSRRSKRGGQRRRRGGQNRNNDGRPAGKSGNRSRSRGNRRPRGRQGEQGDRPSSGGGGNRRRRRRKPQGEQRRTPSD